MSPIFQQHKFILASASPRRQELIAMLGITPEILPSDLEEHATTDDPEQMVKELSLLKANDIASRYHAGEIIIGADTCVAVKEVSASQEQASVQILGKPHSHEEAAQMIHLLASNVHLVYTGVTLIQADGSAHPKTLTFAESTKVHVSSLTDAEIKAYADSDEPMDKAGSYGIQGEFAPFIEGVEGDFYNVMGLPVSRLYRELKNFLM